MSIIKGTDTHLQSMAENSEGSIRQSLGHGSEHDRQRGFSLISVLNIMSIVLLAVVTVSQSRVNYQTTQKSMKIKRSYTDINEALASDIINTIHLNLSASTPCLALNSLTANYNAGRVIVSSLPSYSFVSSVPVNASTWPKSHQDAGNRCARPRTPSDGNSTIDNRIYLCVRRGQDLNASSDSIVNSAGMAVTTALYWQAQTGNRAVNSQKVLSYIANQN